MDSTSKEQLQKEAQEFKQSPWAFWVVRGKLTYLVIAAILVFGITTALKLPKEVNPEVQVPIVNVTTVFPGASPADVEEQVTKELEKELTNLTGVKRMDSSSQLSVSYIEVEFEAGEDVEEALQDLKDQVDKAKFDLPDEAKEPVVAEVDLNDQPIIELTLSSDQVDIAQVKNIAEDVKDEIKKDPLVSEVKLTGGADQTIRIDIDQDKLTHFGLSLEEVIRVLSSANVNFPLGSIEIGSSNYNLRLEGQFQAAAQVANLPVGTATNGRMIYLEDIAQVRDGFTKEISRSYFSTGGSEMTEAVTLRVHKKKDGSVTTMAQNVHKKIESLKGTVCPASVTMQITDDASKQITQDLDSLVTNGTGTVILILIIIFFFLGWREAFLAGPAIPFSFLIGFVIMSWLGESMNFVSLFALILSLGILVDAAVVIVEGMYHKVSVYGLNSKEAALLTIREYAAPLTSGTLTTVAAFFPILFVGGIFGQFMRTIPVVVIATLLAGLFVSISVTPAIGSLLMRKKNNGRGDLVDRPGDYGKNSGDLPSRPYRAFYEGFAAKRFKKVIERYRNFIPKVLGNKKYRRLLIFGSWGVFMLSLLLPITGLLKADDFRPFDAEFFFINIEMPPGTTLKQTKAALEPAEEILKKELEVENFITSVGFLATNEGGGDGGQTVSSEGTSHQGNIKINLVDKENRKRASYEIAPIIRKKIEPLLASKGQVSLVEVDYGPPAGSPVEVRVTGPDLLVLEELANQIKEKVEKIPFAIDADTSLEFSSGEFVFYPDKEVLAIHGLTVAQVVAQGRSGIARDDNIDITRDGEEIKFDIGFKEEKLTSLEDLKGITIVTPQGQKVSLAELGEIKLESALTSINRRDNERVAVITSQLATGGNPTEANNQLVKELESLNLPNGYRLIFGGEAQELQAVYTDMLLKMFMGIVIILFILMLQFNSVKQTLIILFSIPLALVGVLWGLTIFRMTLDIPAFIGVVSLAGIVVNDAIILIDQINKNLKKKKNDVIAAVQQAGCDRFQPIFLTTITTIIGLLPISLTQPLWSTLGFSIIFGLSLASFLTLFVIPAMYVSLMGNSQEQQVEPLNK